MTAQITDKFTYRGEQYSLIGIRGGDLFSPEGFGMEPEIIHTACYRGFYAKYELTDKALLLKELTIREKNDKYVLINTVRPIMDRSNGTARYENIDLVVPFTGKIRLAKDFIDALYIHMGYPKASVFNTILDIQIDNGKTIEIKDRSKEMEQKRGDFKRRYESGNIIEGINQAFSLDLDLE